LPAGALYLSPPQWSERQDKMDLDTMTTAKGLKAARKALGNWNQAQLAAAIGVHKVTVAKMEAGMRPISRLTALAVECLLWRAGRLDIPS
jgi:DNA-binding XRE family transcriptional regulator